MTPQQIEQLSTEKAEQIRVAIREFIGQFKGKHARKGAINMRAIEAKTGIKRVGIILPANKGRKGINLVSTIRILEGIRVLCAETGNDFTPLAERINKVLFE